MMRIHAYVQNTFNALRSFSKGLFMILLIIAPMMGIEAICEGSVPQLEIAVSHHPLSLTLFQWFCWLLLFEALACAFRFLIAFMQRLLDNRFYFAPYATMMMWTILCEVIVYENVLLIFLNYWKHH